MLVLQVVRLNQPMQKRRHNFERHDKQEIHKYIISCISIREPPGRRALPRAPLTTTQEVSYQEALTHVRGWIRTPRLSMH